MGVSMSLFLTFLRNRFLEHQWVWWAHVRMQDLKSDFCPCCPQVNFLVTLRATHCLSEPYLLRLRALGFSEELTVELHTLCDCNCSDTQPRAPYCSDGQGLLQCGVCR